MIQKPKKRVTTENFADMDMSMSESSVDKKGGDSSWSDSDDAKTKSLGKMSKFTASSVSVPKPIVQKGSLSSFEDSTPQRMN